MILNATNHIESLPSHTAKASPNDRETKTAPVKKVTAFNSVCIIIHVHIRLRCCMYLNCNHLIKPAAHLVHLACPLILPLAFVKVLDLFPDSSHFC